MIGFHAISSMATTARTCNYWNLSLAWWTPFGLGSRVIRGPCICLVSRLVESCVCVCVAWRAQLLRGLQFRMLHWYSTKNYPSTGLDMLSCSWIMARDPRTLNSLFHHRIHVNRCKGANAGQWCRLVLQPNRNVPVVCALFLGLRESASEKSHAVWKLKLYVVFLMLYRLCCWIWWLKAHSVPFVASAGHGLVNVCIHWIKLYKGDQRSLHTCFQSGCSFPFGFCNAPCLIMYACLPLCRMKPWMLQQPGGIDRFKGSCQVVIRRSWRNLLSSAHAYHASLVKCKKNMYG